MVANDFTDAEIVEAVKGKGLAGGRAFHIANHLTGRTNGVCKAFLRGLTKRLVKMEAAGLVRRDAQASYPNSYFWVIP